MSDKKHIDRLFQEGFKDFEATPSDAVWKNIESKLNEKKKKRRVIPIWWRYAGVAALLLLLLTIGGIVLNNSDEGSTNQVVDTETKTDTEKRDLENNNTFNENTTETTIVTSDNNSKDATSTSQSELIKDNLNPSKETSVANTSSSTNKNKSKLVSSDKLNIKQNSVAPNNNTIANNSSEEKSNVKNLQDQLEKNTEVANTSENENIETNKKPELVNKEKAKTLLTDTSESNTTIANVNTESVNKTTDENAVEKTKEVNKLSIEEAINKNNTIAENTIKEDNKLKSKWSVTPNIAPVYFNTLKDGSSIDPQFNNNSKSGDINMSYGISTSYALNNKLSVRSGIHSVNLGYNTNDVVVFQTVGTSTNSSALQNIDPASGNVSLLSSESLDSNASASIVTSNASINQNLRYVEIPLEIQYTLSDKKFGVNLIGGFSSFFLNTSKVFYEEDNGNRTILGEAKNINKLSYSANFGFGLNYKISEKFDFNLEPMFKYQFNTFNNTSGNFSPFFIGVYSGFAIKF